MKMRALLIALPILLGTATATHAQVSVSIGLPTVHVGINVPVYPQLVLVPDYPVYYDPQADSNYFFYDGLYWVYEGDNWYASSWYNGPWQVTGPEYVPEFILRVPVRYYRRPPTYFVGWHADTAPRWGVHWGRDWEQRRSGWDRWDRRSAPRAAPLPEYQRQYSGNRYPRAAQQQESIRTTNYRHEPQEAATRQHLKQERQEAANPTRRADRSPQPQQEAIQPTTRAERNAQPQQEAIQPTTRAERNAQPQQEAIQPTTRAERNAQPSASPQTDPQSHKPARTEASAEQQRVRRGEQQQPVPAQAKPTAAPRPESFSQSNQPPSRPTGRKAEEKDRDDEPRDNRRGKKDDDRGQDRERK